METIEWENGVLKIIDQTRLPTQEVVLYIGNIKDCRKAIERLGSGEPAIGDAAARRCVGAEGYRRRIDALCPLLVIKEYLASSRPTAVNLFKSLDRMDETAEEQGQEHPGDKEDTGRRGYKDLPGGYKYLPRNRHKWSRFVERRDDRSYTL